MKEEIKSPQNILDQAQEEFRSLDDGDFFDTGSDGNLYFHPDKVTDWWLSKFQSFIEAEIEKWNGLKKKSKEGIEYNNVNGLGQYNQAIDDFVSHLKELLVTLKK